MAKFVAEYKVSGDTLVLHVRNKQLDASEVHAFLDKALKDADTMENIEFVTIRRVKVKPEPKKVEVKK